MKVPILGHWTMKVSQDLISRSVTDLDFSFRHFVNSYSDVVDI